MEKVTESSRPAIQKKEGHSTQIFSLGGGGRKDAGKKETLIKDFSVRRNKRGGERGMYGKQKGAYRERDSTHKDTAETLDLKRGGSGKKKGIGKAME